MIIHSFNGKKDCHVLKGFNLSFYIPFAIPTMNLQLLAFSNCRIAEVINYCQPFAEIILKSANFKLIIKRE